MAVTGVRKRGLMRRNDVEHGRPPSRAKANTMVPSLGKFSVRVSDGPGRAHMVQMIGFLEHQGVKTGMLTPCQESLITRARNLIANEFLRQKSYTHLLFIDADIGFQPELPWKYLQADKDVVCGIYPVKYLDIEKLRSIDPAAMAPMAATVCLTTCAPSWALLLAWSEPSAAWSPRTGTAR